MKHKKIGVWGLGVSGSAIVQYLLKNHGSCEVLNRTAPEAPAQFAVYLDPQDKEKFFETCDTIIPSPGIDLRPYTDYKKKFLAEIDLFQSAWKKKIIAVTGTLGKTSITHLLDLIFAHNGIPTVTGGNIGVGMLDLVSSSHQQALLELSSFQLENARTFSPDLAIWTNFFPNHLDRHGTLDAYFAAKKNILLHQNSNQKALVPLELAPQIVSEKKLKNRSISYFASSTSDAYNVTLKPDDTLYCFDRAGNILRNSTIILPVTSIPHVSYKNNWLIIAAALDLLEYDAQKLIGTTTTLTLPHYRLEKIATVNGIKYYNDSKSTIMQATVAAVNEIKNGPIILLLGGLCKGVDRSEFISQLKNKVAQIICFGQEAELLHTTCHKLAIPAQACATLENALDTAVQHAQPHSSILLSPGGASFDLFKNYQERGERFKELVLKLT